MAVQIVKKPLKVKDVSKLDVTEVVLPEQVDDFAKMSLKLAKKKEKMAPLSKKVAAAEKSILSTVDTVVDESIPVTLYGEEYDLEIGKKGTRTKLSDPLKAAEMLGEDLFLKLASISITDLKKYLTPEQVAEVTETEYAIKRRVKIEVK